MADTPAATPAAPRLAGTVKWFNVAKGFGFIARNDEEADVFVHQTAIQATGFRSLEDGEEVEFEVSKRDKGFEAVNVTGPKGAAVRGSKRRPRRRRRAPANGEGGDGDSEKPAPAAAAPADASA